MKQSITFAFEGTSLPDAKALIEARLSLAMTEHESISYGPEHWRHRTEWGGENLLLVPNLNPIDNEWIVEEHKEYTSILYANKTTRADFFTSRLSPPAIVLDIYNHKEDE